jgi:predicted nucleic acid-binding protein
MMSTLQVDGKVECKVITKNSVFVDTSGWAYLLDRSSELHQSVSAIYKQILSQQRSLITSNYIIAELVALLTSRSRISRQQIIKYIDTLKLAPQVEILNIGPDLDADSWAFLKTYADKKWSLVDASSFVIMKQHGMTEAITTDHHFTQAGFIQLPRENSK